jgi:very-short-patch-repair endonuclease
VKAAAREGEGNEKERESPPPLAGGGWGEGAECTSLLTHARTMRHAPTPAERKLWQGLRKHQDSGLKFRRQVPLRPDIADLYCPSARLVIEVDGISHIDAPGDAVRDAWMTNSNIRVVRISNRDVFRNLEGILIALGELARTPPPPSPLPQGEGVSSGSNLTTAIFLDV